MLSVSSSPLRSGSSDAGPWGNATTTVVAWPDSRRVGRAQAKSPAARSRLQAATVARRGRTGTAQSLSGQQSCHPLASGGVGGLLSVVVMEPGTTLYAFGPFLLDTRERRLLRDGEVVPLTLKAFDLLQVLVENQGHLLQKEELLRRVWPDAAVEENNLTVTISALRKALDEGPTDRQYIETVPRRGYRFVADLRASP